MKAHRAQFPDDRTTPEVGRRQKAEEAAQSDPDPVTRAVIRQWLYHDKITAQSGPAGDDISDIGFAALTGDYGPTVR
jgi:hypothetical protein